MPTPRTGPLGVLSATGSMLYRDVNGNVTDLVPAVDGRGLTLVGGIPAWSAGALGDVVGPAASTDNAIARYDSITGKLIQNSAVTISDTGTIAETMTVDGSILSVTPATASSKLGLTVIGTAQVGFDKNYVMRLGWNFDGAANPPANAGYGAAGLVVESNYNYAGASRAVEIHLAAWTANASQQVRPFTCLVDIVTGATDAGLNGDNISLTDRATGRNMLRGAIANIIIGNTTDGTDLILDKNTNSQIKQRNGASNAYVPILFLDALDRINLGDNGYNLTKVFAPIPMHILGATAISAGGIAGDGYMFSTTANFGIFYGSGAPSLVAAKGSLYLRSDGTGINDRVYVNTNGGTTWTALVSVA